MSKPEAMADAARKQIRDGIDYLIQKDGYQPDDIVSLVENICDEIRRLGRVTMSALSDALAAAQAKALAALEKAYVAGQLDYEEMREQMDMIGCSDDIDQDLLIFALDTLKKYGVTAPAYSEKRTEQVDGAVLRTASASFGLLIGFACGGLVIIAVASVTGHAQDIPWWMLSPWPIGAVIGAVIGWRVDV